MCDWNALDEYFGKCSNTRMNITRKDKTRWISQKNSNAEGNNTIKTIDWIRTNVLKLYARPWNKIDNFLSFPKERQRF